MLFRCLASPGFRALVLTPSHERAVYASRRAVEELQALGLPYTVRWSSLEFTFPNESVCRFQKFPVDGHPSLRGLEFHAVERDEPADLDRDVAGVRVIPYVP